MALLILLYLTVGAVVCGANYFVMQERTCRTAYEELDCTFSSIGIGVFWPFCIGVVTARVYQYVQRHK